MKYTKKRNYKNTAHVHWDYIQAYNMLFLKKHSAMGVVSHNDTIGYQNNHNILPSTVGFSAGNIIVSTQLFSHYRNKHIHLISTDLDMCASFDKLWPGASFYERELGEMLGIRMSMSVDTRRLLLEYNDFSNPLKKHNHVGTVSFKKGRSEQKIRSCGSVNVTSV